MTKNKICPIMSKPDQTDKAGFESEQEMKDLGWYPSQGHPWGNVFQCQTDKCVAWVDICPLINENGALPEACLKYEGTNLKCHRNRRTCEAHCKLIDGGVNTTRHGADTVMDDFIPNSFHIEESKSLVDLQKEQIILMLKNYGGVNKHKVKAGETWNYHFDKDCIVLLVFDEDE